MFGPLTNKDLRYIGYAILTGVSFLVIVSIYYFDISQFRFYLPGVMQPLVISRFVGAGTIILIFKVLDLEQRRRMVSRVFYSFMALLCILLIFATGSRGPAIYVIAGVLVTLFINNKIFSRKKLITYSLITLVVSSMIVLVGVEIGLPGFNRIATLFPWLNIFDPHSTQSSIYRLQGYEQAFIGFFNNNFMAIGTGSFDAISRFEYPHNIILEVMVELGVIALIALSVLYYNSYKKILQIKNIVNENNLIFVGLFIFAFLDSMTSGDIAKNHLFFVFTAILLNISYFQKIEITQLYTRSKDFTVEKTQDE
jgi:O-antigen ligase